MKLGELIAGTGAELVTGDPNIEIKGVETDSRQIGKNFLFVATAGSNVDGHDFISEAVSQGAAAVMTDRSALTVRDAALVLTADLRRTLPEIAVRFYNDPSGDLTVVGITGTNGKTTTSFILNSILEAAGQKTGIIGTTGYFLGELVLDAPNTTPDTLLLNRVLALAREQNLSHMVIEVSSHALSLDRIRNIQIRSAVFTNLSQDHLDFHGGMEEYFAAKSRLFEITGGKGAVNTDDPYGRRVFERFSGLVTFGEDGIVRAEEPQFRLNGTDFMMTIAGERFPVRSKLVGRPNIENSMAAAALAWDLGIEKDDILKGLERAGNPPGRFELVQSGGDFGVAVDYAHTPDALERLLQTGKGLNPERLLVVFGCGGDRDRTKRPLMGRAASEHADMIWVTSDNPRTEDPEEIIEEIVPAIEKPFRRITNRREAIFDAVNELRDGDLLLIAGKGHEDYQILGREKIHFDDREVVREALDERRTQS